MNTNPLPPGRVSGIGLITLVLGVVAASAATFTSDTIIGVQDTNFDGADIVISNCVVTVDGPHNFNSLLVRSGGRLTHTQVPEGNLIVGVSITGEAHVLSSTNPITLNHFGLSALTVRDSTGTITYSNGVDYEVIAQLYPVIYRTSGSAIADGATVLLDYTYAATVVPARLDLAIAGDALVEAGGAINADAKGYSPNFGPGPGSSQGNPASGSGAGHGGYGGWGSSNSTGGLVYDSILQPSDKGCGGGAGLGGVGGIGGGAIKLVVGGTLQIDGAISANGANGLNSRSGGGSGGSIWLSSASVTGAGSIFADGGAGEPIHGGGGGGGRIALYFATNSFAGGMFARGGVGHIAGGAGTIYTRNTNQPAGAVRVDNGGRAGTNTLFSAAEPFDVSVLGRAIASPSPSGQGTTIGNLLVASNSSVVAYGAAALTLTALGDVAIQSGGGIRADGAGFPAGLGTGAGGNTNAGGFIGFVGSGGGHGGAGGAAAVGPVGGGTYGFVASPNLGGSGGGLGGGLASSGPGGAGGGVIRLIVIGDLLVDGSITANGVSPTTVNAGGGAGGSVWVTSSSLKGSGIISANGGAGNNLGGGGGGGRVALYFQTNLFSGPATAFGGGGASWGGAGTVVRGQFPAGGYFPDSVVVDNGGRVGANTSLGTFSTTTADLTVSGGASLQWPLGGSFTIRNLLVGSASALLVSNVQGSFISVTSNATIQAGGSVIGDGGGFPGGQGQGFGGTSFSPIYGTTSGGGGYGGLGGTSLGGAGGGNAYGTTLTQPTDRGSGGGNANLSPPNAGGAGGGAVRISVTGTLLLDGRISANGKSGIGPNTGGGSGGSLWLNAGTLTGSGSITANGGAGNNFGGGGAGGRIAITYGTNVFSGTISAAGAVGAGGGTWGGAGTIFTKVNNSFTDEILIDNAGHDGTTPLGLPSPSSGSFLTITGRAAVVTSGYPFIGFGPSLRNLYIAADSKLLATNTLNSLLLTVTSNMTIEAGGLLSVDGSGYIGGQGTGAGRTTISQPYGMTGGGGSYGGVGGTSVGGATGGPTYGTSLSEPTALGSGGGAGSGLGGTGGGSLRLNVTGTLLLNGRISANGRDPVSFNSGGGSGGSVWLTAGKLAGSGIISVNGGAGLGYGGGGGGGRIGASSGTNLFTGVITAYGGAGGGGVWGGAGSIFIGSTSRTMPPGQVVLDNAGHAGSSSLVSGQTMYDLTVGPAVALLLPSAVSIANLLIATNGSLVLGNPGTTSPSLTVSNAAIQAGGMILADTNGYAVGTGPGAGQFMGGAGHGGSGVRAGGTSPAGSGTYDSQTQPAIAGSGGAPTLSTGGVLGGAGGGIIRLTVTKKLQLDGEISADGGPGIQGNSTFVSGAGGGSGGSIWLTLGELAGSGRITANGGSGWNTGGGGGGGRIAVYCSSNQFAGSLQAFGGSSGISNSAGFGGAGTIYLSTNGPNQSVFPQLIVNNGGHAGTNTPLSEAVVVDLSVLGNAVVTPVTSALLLRNLLVGTNSSIQLANLNLTVSRNATIEAGGGILANGTGFAGGGGQGAGRSVSTSSGITGSGAGYGGSGANSSGGALGGFAYGSPMSPTLAGSGGGSGAGTATGGTGGGGGGVLRLTVVSNLVVNGSISADGRAGIGVNSGGGSGGSLWLTAGRLSGLGKITVNGGAGNGTGGGGGGGGRIALNYGTNLFDGVLSSYGGGGFGRGGAGTIYLQPNIPLVIEQIPIVGELVVDNGGVNGATTPLQTVGSQINLTVRGAAVAAQSVPSLLIRQLVVASNSWLLASNASTMNLSYNATIQAGGNVSADRRGSPGGTGAGVGGILFSSLFGYTGGGGGHGGFGSTSVAGAAGGNAFGNLQFPIAGSGGGGNPANFAGAGGGSILFNAPSLIVDGRFSADGGDSISPQAGGGSGGGLQLSVGTLSGSGIISASGGDSILGGGGGGGRIALTCSNNTFAGEIRAWGGIGGGGVAGAGTLYLKTNNQPIARIFVDNGGLSGTNTPVPSLANISLTVSRGGIVNPVGPYLALNDLLVDTNGLLTNLRGQSNLNVVVYGPATIAPGGALVADRTGFVQGNGPGSGQSSGGYGSGAGYGGAGGASFTAPGGVSYGSVTQPVDRGSGGGFGFGPVYGGSEGGGALRLNVGGTLTVNGRVGANGSDGIQDSAGGGSGGSVWMTVGALTGNGRISADGGMGELYGGGGGAGGRIAIYYRTNLHTSIFTGLMSAFGGEGFEWGEDGTILVSSSVATVQVIAQDPVGVVSNSVTVLELTLNTPVKPASVSGDDFSLVTPGGTLYGTNLALQLMAPDRLQFLLPPQTAPGDYTVRFGPNVEDLYGRPMSQLHTGTFTVVLPTIQGLVLGTNGLPVPGVVLQPNGGMSPAITDADGRYALGFVPGSSFSVTPEIGGCVFVPGSRTYNHVTSGLTNENYLVVTSLAPILATELQGTNLITSWLGIEGVTYQLYSSTNLTYWIPYGEPIVGSNAMIEIAVPIGSEPKQFFRVKAGN